MIFRPYVYLNSFFIERCDIMRVFIGCSSYNSINIKYKELAQNVSELLARRGDKLVFGGTDAGMMNKCFQTFRYYGCKVKAVSDVKYIDDLKEMDYDRETVTPTTFERCKELYLSSELIVILPGGLGTLSEIFGMIEEKRTREDKKDIIIFNYEGYYDNILNQIKKEQDEGFIGDDLSKLIIIINSLDELKEYLERRN